MNYWVTGAAINPSENMIALMGHSCVWIIRNFSSKISAGEVYRIDLNHFSHKAGITFRDDKSVFIIDEVEFGMIGGKLYLLSLELLLPKLQ